MLKAITNWKALCAALAARGERIYQCIDCDHLWVGNGKKTPVRCPNRECRAFANSPRRASVGRPPAED